jgi:uncharacterized protein
MNDSNNMIIPRDQSAKLKSLVSQFPAVAVLGPRQSGKTTLVRITFPNYRYFSFEDPDIRDLVRTDPRGFLNRYTNEIGVIFDEIQRAPDLISYMQTHIDQAKKIGYFIITGSQNLLLNEAISQSLAGRIAILTLLPLSMEELKNNNLLPDTIDNALFRGSYPPVYTDAVLPLDWYRSYINTYIERDVRQIKNIMNLSTFQSFMRLCAGRIGQVLNITSLSNDSGMSTHAVRQWLSILEASYIIFLLQPYYRNFSKRTIKSPKLYFYDTGVACSLLSISSSDQIFSHYLRGNLFESYIIADFFKQRLNKGLNPDCYFWRDSAGYEIDCIIEKANKFIPVEIKANQTFNKNFLNYLTQWNTISTTKPEDNILVYGGDLDQNSPLGHIFSWRSVGNLLNSLLVD